MIEHGGLSAVPERKIGKPERSLHARTSQRRINKIEDLFATDDAWREALAAAVKEFIPRVTAARGHLAERARPAALFRLDGESQSCVRPDRALHSAAAMEDTRVAAHQEMVAQVTLRWSSFSPPPLSRP